MLVSKLKAAVAVVLVLGLVAIGATGFGIARGQPKIEVPQESEKAQKGKMVKEKAEAIAWGKEVDGLQMGLALMPEDTHTVRQGKKAKFAVKLRNVGKAEVSVTHAMLRDCAPEITTDTGGRVSVSMPPPASVLYSPPPLPIKRALKPGETITLYNPEVAVEPEDRRAKVLGEMWLASPTICVAPGKYKIAFGGMIQSHPKLTTGTVEFEVKEPAEAFTEWGKEVGGLQAGLGFRPGEKRPYHHGEEAGIVLRLRNIGKAPVEFSHIGAFFVENPPTITDADGKVLPLPKLAAEGLQAPHDTPIAPGQEVVLYEWNCGLQPIGGISKNLFTIHGTGKFTLQCTRIVGPTTGNPNHPNPTLDKLATGKLELEVKDSPPGKTDGPSGSRAPAPDKRAEAPADSAYTTADIVVQYRDESGREVRDLQQFRVDDAEAVAKLASHFPGILGDRGSGPRTTAGKHTTFTIKFNHKSGEASQLRVAHVTADYATWVWRDNTPYTGDRKVEGKDQLQTLLEKLAAKNKVDLK